MSWCTIESDPGVFTELIRSIGVEGVQVEELYDLDLDHLLSLVPVYGLIFLFKWESGDVPDIVEGRELLSSDAASHIFFARQMIQNACATQAIISVLLNNPNIQLGDQLTAFKSFTMDLPADMRGESIGESEFIRTAHNAFARPEPFIFEEKKDDRGEPEDAFHFIGYVPIQGVLYELDGLKPAPISLGPLYNDTPQEWLSKARASIQKRVEKYAEKEIRFNLLALVQNRKQLYSQQLQQLQQQLDTFMDTEPILNTDNTNTNTNTNTTNSTTNTGSTDANTTGTVAANGHIDRQVLLDRKEELHRLIAIEEAKELRWSQENIRRKHNYVPFIFHLLKLLAEKDKLSQVVEQAAKITAERNARVQMKKQKKKENNISNNESSNNNNRDTSNKTASTATTSSAGTTSTANDNNVPKAK